MLPGPLSQGSLEAQGLSRAFGDLQVLHDDKLTVGRGRIAAVVGENGTGKTTLLRILAGVLDPDAGTVTIAGRPPGHGKASFVPAGDRMLNWRLTGRQNLSFFAELAGAPPDAVDTAGGLLDAAALLDKLFGECSTGQRRRLMLAAGFVARPPVVLLDEPFADLDEPGRDTIARACRAWAGASGVVVYAAPTLSDGPPADLTYRLAGGRLERAS
jgi:ABC-2 type transport system ATP-binding protein